MVNVEIICCPERVEVRGQSLTAVRHANPSRALYLLNHKFHRLVLNRLRLRERFNVSP